MNDFWTDALVDQIRAFHAQGLRDSAIGKLMDGISKSKVGAKRRRLGLPTAFNSSDPRPRETRPTRDDQGFWTVENIDRLKALHTAKHSLRQIAKLMGTTRNVIGGKAKRLGLVSPNGPTAREKPSEPNIPKPKRIPPAPIQEVTVIDDVEFIGPVNSFPDDRGTSCRYPRGEPGVDFQCCGKPVAVSGSPYCGHHMRIAFRPMAAKKAA